MNIQLKTTDILNLGNKLYFAGYCELQCITDLLDKVGHYANIHGWQCDVYKLTDEKTGSEVYLLTGYGYPNRAGKKIKELDYKLVEALNQKYQAKGFISKTPENKRKAVKDILKLVDKNNLSKK